MKYNMFGEPLPDTAAEIAQAMEASDLDPGTVQVLLAEDDEHGDPVGNTGWCAEISDGGAGDGFFVTLNFPNRNALVEALAAAGIGQAQIEDI